MRSLDLRAREQVVDTMRTWLTPMLLTGCALVMLVGCSSDDEAGDHTIACMPNASATCECPGAAPSTATCLPDGSGMTPCACASAVGAGSASGTPFAGGNADAGSTGATDSGAPGATGRADAGRSDAGSGMPSTPSGTPSGDGGAATTGGPAMPSAGCGMQNPPASGSQMLDVDGVQRQYIVKVPTVYDPNRAYRLVFAWHGLGGTAMQIASTYYGLAARSMDSAIFIAGQGLKGTGQQSGLANWSAPNDGDITFTRKMLAWAKTNYCIDEKRVFSIGMSNGGMMSNIVGCELGDSFRAMAAMSGGGPKGYAMKPCTGQIAVWISHGNKDDNVPFSYGQMSRDYWAKANHCGMETAPAMPGTCVEYQGCDPGFPVQFCEFDGGHMVPSFAGEAAWKFFERF